MDKTERILSLVNDIVDEIDKRNKRGVTCDKRGLPMMVDNRSKLHKLIPKTKAFSVKLYTKAEGTYFSLSSGQLSKEKTIGELEKVLSVILKTCYLSTDNKSVARQKIQVHIEETMLRLLELESSLKAGDPYLSTEYFSEATEKLLRSIWIA